MILYYSGMNYVLGRGMIVGRRGREHWKNGKGFGEGGWQGGMSAWMVGIRVRWTFNQLIYA